jgi:hypothetical protein
MPCEKGLDVSHGLLWDFDIVVHGGGGAACSGEEWGLESYCNIPLGPAQGQTTVEGSRWRSKVGGEGIQVFVGDWEPRNGELCIRAGISYCWCDKLIYGRDHLTQKRSGEGGNGTLLEDVWKDRGSR